MTQQETHAGRGPTALVRRALGRHEVRYLLVAGTTTLFYLALVGAGLLAGLPYMLAIACAHAVTICAAFPAYRHLVFRSRRAWPADLWRFLSVWSGGMVAGFVATPLLVELAGMPPFAAQVLAIVVVAVSSYLAHRFWSFGHREPDDAPAHAAGTGGGPG
jgi:putative flippase GtrA